jgi:Asp-tRNA(Asn)/Glu-tRNA(Gln) amidotransferase A subunit family amidase
MVQCNNAGMREQFPVPHPQAEGVESSSTATDRRSFLALCSVAGLGGTLLPGALLALAAKAEGQVPAAAPTAGGRGRRGAGAEHPADGLVITDAMIDAAAAIAGITITDDQKKLLMNGLQGQRRSVAAIRELHMPNSVAPAFIFDPVPAGMTLDTVKKPMKISAAPKVPMERSQILECVNAGDDLAKSNPLAFLTLRELAELVKTRKVTSTELTKMYLARLKKLDPILRFVITLTEERAMKQAAAADAEIAAGKYRGPLHGIPWGGKDLLAVKGYRTTWGAGGFETQSFDYDAEVVKRLDAAGAVLIAKLTMGALAQNDGWFGGRTRNPWNPVQGSSGSSAGSASATSAGCVGFSIGTETQGSISSPSTRCGVTGLRPTFGLVPRTGAMALSWTMDKIGPICRSVEDCAIVLSTIYGQDGHDLSLKPAAFNWDAAYDWKKLRVGYVKSAFEPDPLPADATDQQKAQRERGAADAAFATASIAALKKMGVELIPVEMPVFPFQQITPVLQAEAAAAFEDLTLSHRDNLLTGQTAGDWPTQFRVAHFYTAVDYVQAMRARTLAIAEMQKLFDKVDVVVTTGAGSQSAATNLCGHPAVIVPNGVRPGTAIGPDGKPIAPPAPPAGLAGGPGGGGGGGQNGGPGTPVSLTFLGALYSDARVAALARAYQDATGFHKLHPPVEKLAPIA